MARRARNEILYDGSYAHVFSRSFERRPIFQDPLDFETFRDFLTRSKKQYGFLIHHYCLMNTHFHLAVSLPSLRAFSSALQKVKWHYTTYYNHKHDRQGPLWRERFKSLLIEDEKYLYACGLYIESNPVQAGLVENPEDWPYSSSRHYLEGTPDPLVDPYENEGLPEEVDEEVFTTGVAIGSELFLLQLSEEAFGSVSVPRRVTVT